MMYPNSWLVRLFLPLFLIGITSTRADYVFDPPHTHDDAWEYTLIQITGGTQPLRTPSGDFSVDDMFGAMHTTYLGANQDRTEHGHTVFTDDVQDFTYFVDFETRHHIRLDGFRLMTGPEIQNRILKECSLQIDSNNDNQYENVVTFGLATYPVNFPGVQTQFNSNDVTVLFPQRLARKFRLKFVRHDAPGNAGPRICEVDAITSAGIAPPEITLQEPNGPGRVFAFGEPIALTASATDADGIEQVEFFAQTENGLQQSWGLGEAQGTNQFSFSKLDADPGRYNVFAVATDLMGEKNQSPSIEIEVARLATQEPQLLEPRLLEGKAAFSITNLVPNSPFVVELSNDLSVWSAISTNVAQGTLEIWTEPQSAKLLPRRFYRVLVGDGSEPTSE